MTGFDVTLLRPWWLLALPALAAFGWWVSRYRAGLGDWQTSVDPELLQAMTALGRVERSTGTGPLVPLLCALGLIVVGLSGPAVERRQALSFRNLDGVLFVVDTSDSVITDPRWPQMLAVGRLGLSVLGARPGGLIVYAGDAYVASEMTLDHVHLGQSLSLIAEGMVPDKGSRPGLALGLAAQLLGSADVIAGDVILFTDGEGLDPDSLAATSAIVSEGARLSLVSMSTPTPLMQTHAGVGQGAVFTLDQSAALSNWLQDTARSRLEAQNYPLLFWRDMGRWLLALALIPLLLVFRRGAT